MVEITVILVVDEILRFESVSSSCYEVRDKINKLTALNSNLIVLPKILCNDE